MKVFEKIRQRILKFLKLEHLGENPNSERFTFINDINTVNKQKLEEYRIWFVGDSDELENFYTTRNVGGNAKEPIYNRNKTQYFWAISITELPYKKVHSGIPKAIVDTLSNAIGEPVIACEEKADVLEKILEENNFCQKLTQEARPLTMVEGWGAWKPVFDKNLSNYPIIQFYEGKDVDFVIKNGVIIGIVYQDYYRHKNKDYVLLETRRIDNCDSVIEFELYRLEKSNTVERVPLDTIEELAYLPEDGYRIKGLKKVLGVPTRYFFDLFDKQHGRSIFQGKIDVFDDLDQCVSQASQTDRVSTPVEYYPEDLLERRGGKPILPKVYNRQYVMKPSFTNGDGKNDSEIQTTQPQLNYEQYITRFKSLCDIAFTGLVSPATMGIDIAKKDNAEAQREKEKITIFTRSNIIAGEIKQIKELIKICLMLKEYMDTDYISLVDYNVSVKYDEVANPTFEGRSQVLLPMLTQGGISTKLYVEKLYKDGLSEEEKQQEIAEIEKRLSKDNIDIGDFVLEDDKRTSVPNSEQEARNKEEIDRVEE